MMCDAHCTVVKMVGVQEPSRAPPVSLLRAPVQVVLSGRVASSSGGQQAQCEAPAPGMVIQYQAGRVHRALCLEPVGSGSIPGMPSGRSSIVQINLNTKFVNNFFYSQK